ncbi:hypothetical protein [Alicyclobacillus fodiniaquatilis]|uniref:SWIM-type domain-containing protein n=1 Tax=Alicyclobacillus fodiniaquatilis TaxID=1661150 RepID=A0ABW4JB49_9BACL
MSAKARISVVEQAWKNILQQADKSRVRRGKQDARAGVVHDVHMRQGVIAATVKATGPERGNFQVVLPCLADYTAYANQVAKWLAHRPDWIAAHFSGEWDIDLIDFVNENGLTLFPDDSSWNKLQDQTKCTCSDWQPLCVHAFALLHHLLAEAQQHPLAIFRFVGLEVDWLLDQAHRESEQWLRHAHPVRETLEPSAFGAGGPQRTIAVPDDTPMESSGRLVPQFDQQKRQMWTHPHHMA